jgi:ATP-dependent Lon protease
VDPLTTTTRDDLRAWDVPSRVPLLVLRSTHVFPLGVSAAQVTGTGDVAAVRALSTRRPIVVVVRADTPAPAVAELAGRVGVAAIVLDRMNLAAAAVQVTLLGKHRVTIEAVEPGEAGTVARISPLLEPEEEHDALTSQVGAVLRHAAVLAVLDPAVGPELVETLEANAEDPSHFADLVAAQLPFTLAQRDAIVAEPSTVRRLRSLADGLTMAIERALVKRDVDRLTVQQMDKSRREFLLRQQLEAIRTELGDDRAGELRELRERLEAAGLPETARAEALREIERLGRLVPASAEYQVARTYLDWVLDMPWSAAVEERHPDPAAVRAVLDVGHLALDEAKTRIVEYLAVRRLAPDVRTPILCFVGPPGVGKTSLGRAIAEALARPFGRMSVGGVDDEAVIRGHRRTYVGAMPGKIVHELRRLKAKNPVLMIDEIDKLGSGRPGHGDPASALLEVLDPEQNSQFVDHYLNVPFDLSKVLFIATANTAPEIPSTLLDRMEVIEIPGYTIEEKVAIGRKHLLRQLLVEHGLTAEEIALDDATLELVVRGYAREAGVRSIRRQLAALLRRVATRKAAGAAGPWTVDGALVDEVLGPPRFVDARFETQPYIGVANGLAWTTTGGDLLPVEAIAMPGNGAFNVTGRLGDVMLESVQAATSWVRSRARDFGINPTRFRETDVHVHFPEGAIPKDGPSAGVTIATVLASLFTGRPVRHDIAMTGEITITGRVLAVGGLREKLGAAARNGMAAVVIPAANAPDLRDVPETVQRALKIHLVETADEVVRLALMAARRKRTPSRPRGRR